MHTVFYPDPEVYCKNSQITKKTLADDRAFLVDGIRKLIRILEGGKAFVDGAEHVANDRAKKHEDRNNNDSNQNKDQSVLYQTLAFFFRGE